MISTLFPAATLGRNEGQKERKSSHRLRHVEHAAERGTLARYLLRSTVAHLRHRGQSGSLASPSLWNPLRALRWAASKKDTMSSVEYWSVKVVVFVK